MAKKTRREEQILRALHQGAGGRYLPRARGQRSHVLRLEDKKYSGLALKNCVNCGRYARRTASSNRWSPTCHWTGTCCRRL